MRTLRKNRRPLKYALYKGREPIYLRDDDGNIVYQMIDGESQPVETGYAPEHYEEPVEFDGNIAFNSGRVQYMFYGQSLNYDYSLTMPKGSVPITETSIIFEDSEPQYEDGYIIRDSADYCVIRVMRGLNYDMYLLSKI